MPDLKQSPTGLFVGWCVKQPSERDPKSGEGWCVLLAFRDSGARLGCGIAGGPYASKRDAGIGLEAFTNCGVDWSQDPDGIREQIIERGGVEFLDRVAYECLPW